MVSLIKTYAKNLDLDCNSEYEVLGKHVGAYSLYVGVEDTSIYKFKNKKPEYDKEFKTILVLEVLKHKQALADIANEHNVSAKTLRGWKDAFLANVETAFESKSSHKS